MPKQISTVSSQQHKGGAYLLKPSFQQFWILYVIISVLISKELVLDLSVCHINSKKKKKSPNHQTWLYRMSSINFHSSLLSQNSWDGKGLWTSCSSSPLLRAGLTSPGFPGPCLIKFWISPVSPQMFPCKYISLHTSYCKLGTICYFFVRLG